MWEVDVQAYMQVGNFSIHPLTCASKLAAIARISLVLDARVSMCGNLNIDGSTLPVPICV